MFVQKSRMSYSQRSHFTQFMSARSEPAACFLGVVFDFESFVGCIGKRQKSENDLLQVIQQLSLFCTSYALMHRENRLMFLVYDNIEVTFIYPSRQLASLSVDIDHNFIPSLSQITPAIMDGMINLLNNRSVKQESPLPFSGRGLLSSALSNALTTINRMNQSCSLQNRLLCLQFDQDRPQNYNSVMNAIFSAQKMNVMVDSLVLSFDSLLLQQTSFLTHGIYMKCFAWPDFLMTLQMHYLSDNHSRQQLLIPTQVIILIPSLLVSLILFCLQQTSVDFKASCYCCRKPVEFAYMCSVCLTLLCDMPGRACPVCETPVRST